MLNKNDKNGYCNCPDCRSDNCPAADTDNCVQSVTDAKAEAVRNTLTRLWSLLSTHRTMWDAAKGNMATLPSYAQCGLIMDDLQRCCDLLAKEPAPPLSQYEERLEMLKAMDADNDPTATTHLHAKPSNAPHEPRGAKNQNG